MLYRLLKSVIFSVILIISILFVLAIPLVVKEHMIISLNACDCKSTCLEWPNLWLEVIDTLKRSLVYFFLLWFSASLPPPPHKHVEGFHFFFTYNAKMGRYIHQQFKSVMIFCMMGPFPSENY